MNAQNAKIGQTVLYRRWNIAAPIPAIVVEILDDQQATLWVLDPNGPQMKRVAFAQDLTPGHWSFQS